jgi:DNA polymerase-3 subunit gamma/tau
MGQALYRKYRPKSLEQISGQEHITATLERALASGKLSHAYLFTGPRGVGKTSVARILAHAVNDEPYTDESMHLDIIEIDAASNRRIDEIRELIERVRTLPTTGRYKVYIIDEVHMLTREAFNALLKTLEEPPAHAIFILATTEAHKLPATIISRTQRFAFRPIEPAEIAKQLRAIAGAEKIDVDDEVLMLIAEHGEGSFRDSISLLDQVRSSAQPITAEAVRELVGEAPAALLANIEEALASGQADKLVVTLGQLDEQGYEPALISRQLAARLRQHLLRGQASLPADTVMALLSRLIDVPASPEPQIALELALLSSIVAGEPKASTSAPPNTAAAQPPAPATKAKPAKPETPGSSAEPAEAVAEHELGDNVWPDVLAAIKNQHNTLYGVLRMAKPTWHDQELVLTFGFAFHKKRVNETKNLAVIAETLQELTGQTIAIVTKVDNSRSVDPAEPKEADPSLASISNIFGGAELLES